MLSMSCEKLSGLPKTPDLIMRMDRCSRSSPAGRRLFMVFLSAATSSAVAPKQKRLSSPTARAISMFAPSAVPTTRPPFMTNFMFPVPDASMPAVDMCWLTSDAGMISSARDTLKLGMNTTCRIPAHLTSLFTALLTAQASWMIFLATSYPGAAFPAMTQTRGSILALCSGVDPAMTAYLCTMPSTFSNCRLYSCMRFTCMSYMALVMRSTPMLALTHSASRSLFSRLASFHEC
mmetsp:Transcript_10912/g.45458  ORF Transcript_10912/g.45458 Transcript_10912/m.45458 type:complete len:234 (+) Transcript_10912:397-1098(+)